MTTKTMFDTLYHRGKGGEMRVWSVWAEGADVFTEYGIEGGLMQTSKKTCTAKNVGRANEVPADVQAINEAQSLWQFKVDRKYSVTKTDAIIADNNLPMLAHKYAGSKKKNFKFPAYLQPKLDGVRCIAQRDENGQIQLTSRSNKPWNIPLIAAALDKVMPKNPGWIYDGEIYTHGLSCQKITSLSRSADPAGKSYKADSVNLVYHIYDIPNNEDGTDLPFSNRLDLLEELKSRITGKELEVVDTSIIEDDSDIDDLAGVYVGEGYEGVILRAASGFYNWGHRSADLLKHKQFQDEEFEVTGFTQGVGKMEGCVVFRCRNDLTTDEFWCTMKATMEERKRFFDEGQKYVGKKLTVQFFDRTDDNIPRFPVGVVFRDSKDL